MSISILFGEKPLKPKVVRIEHLLKSRRLSRVSPLTLLSKELGIKWLMLWNGYVYGPTPGIVEALDLLITSLKPKSMLDLFCGSGALSKLAYLKRVREITCVDLYVEAAKRNLQRCKNVKIIEGDALSFKLYRNFDLVVADPPEELINKTLANLPRLRRVFRLAALIWIGPYHKAGRRVRLLKKKRMNTVLEAWGDGLAIFWKPKLRERIDSALRLLE